MKKRGSRIPCEKTSTYHSPFLIRPDSPNFDKVYQVRNGYVRIGTTSTAAESSLVLLLRNPSTITKQLVLDVVTDALEEMGAKYPPKKSKMEKDKVAFSYETDKSVEVEVRFNGNGIPLQAQIKTTMQYNSDFDIDGFTKRLRNKTESPVSEEFHHFQN